MATTTITATATVRVRGAEGSPAMASAVARTLGEALGSVLKATPGTDARLEAQRAES